MCKQDKEQLRALGLVLLRGECVVSVAVQSPPPATSKGKRTATAAGLADRPPPPPSSGRGMMPPPPPSVPNVNVAPIQPQLASDPRIYNSLPPLPPPHLHHPYSDGRGAPPPPPGASNLPGGAMPPVAALPHYGRGGPPSYGRGMVGGRMNNNNGYRPSE